MVNLKNELRIMKQTVNDMQDTIESVNNSCSPLGRSTTSKGQNSVKKSKTAQSKSAHSFNDNVVKGSGVSKPASTSADLVNGGTLNKSVDAVFNTDSNDNRSGA